ncbi:MAG TPA: TetR/AcrR family transcriptional regulator [Alphaproteobacteria bacterium]|nr:TetR/AcrR family transcriptional regulator [Alphaproteobacteria bacterium]
MAKSSMSPSKKSKVGRAIGRLHRKEGLRSEAVLEVALSMFSSISYADVTVQEIARRVGVTHSLIYYYFESKEKLFHAALLHALDGVMTQYNLVTLQHEDPIDLLNDWFEVNVEMAEPLGSLVRIMFEFSGTNGRRTPPFVARLIKRFYEFERDTITNCIRRGVETGVLTCDDPERLAVFVSRCIDGIFYGSIVRQNTDIAAEIRDLKAYLWRLLDYRPEKRAPLGAS